MSFFTSSYLRYFLSTRPRLVSYVDSQLDLYKDKYHDQLRLIAGYIAVTGRLTPPVSASGEDTADVVERLVWQLVTELQKEGIIPNTLPYVTISWYVLRWVFVPFLRMLLRHYYNPS